MEELALGIGRLFLIILSMIGYIFNWCVAVMTRRAEWLFTGSEDAKDKLLW